MTAHVRMEHTDPLIEREKSGRATNAKGWPPPADQLEQRAKRKAREGMEMAGNKEESTGRILEGTLPRR